MLAIFQSSFAVVGSLRELASNLEQGLTRLAIGCQACLLASYARQSLQLEHASHPTPLTNLRAPAHQLG